MFQRHIGVFSAALLLSGCSNPAQVLSPSPTSASLQRGVLPALSLSGEFLSGKGSNKVISGYEYLNVSQGSLRNQPATGPYPGQFDASVDFECGWYFQHIFQFNGAHFRISSAPYIITGSISGPLRPYYCDFSGTAPYTATITKGGITIGTTTGSAQVVFNVSWMHPYVNYFSVTLH